MHAEKAMECSSTNPESTGSAIASARCVAQINASACCGHNILTNLEVWATQHVGPSELNRLCRFFFYE
jgi:hypothetical protein